MQAILQNITFFLNIISLFIFFSAFLGKPIFRTLPFGITFICISSCSFLEPYLFYHLTEQTNTIFLMLYSFLLTFITSCLYESSFKHKLFISISYQAFGILSEALVYFLVPSSQKQTIVDDNLNDTFIWSLLSNLILLCIVLVLCHFFKMRTIVPQTNYTIIVIATPILSIISILFVVDYASINIENLYIYQIVLIVFFYIINIINYYLFNYVIRTQQLKEEKNQLEKQIIFQSNKYLQISTAYKKTRSILHDTKQHFFYLDHCINQKDYSALKNYLPTAIENMENAYNRINTGNLVIDAFVSNYSAMAESEGISFQTDIKLQIEQIPINDYDLCVILGNLLDNCMNAIHAITIPQDKKIFVHLFMKEGNFVIHITNTFNNTNITDDKSSLYHGYGCKNIENITTKHKGSYTFYTENNTYTAIVSLPFSIS